MQKLSYSVAVDTSGEVKKDGYFSNSEGYDFELLMVPHLNTLYNMALILTHKKNDAEELVLETFVKAFRDYDKEQNGSNFKILIFSILIMEYIKTYRKTSLIGKKVVNEEVEEFYIYKKLEKLISLKDEEKANILENINENHIRNALENLPDQFRLVLLLFDVVGFSHNHIANIFNISLSDVISRLYASRKLLQKYLWRYTRMSRDILNENKSPRKMRILETSQEINAK